MAHTISKNVIKLIRGDSLWVKLGLSDASGNEYFPTENDSIRFALKKSIADQGEPLIIKQIPYDTLELKLDPEDTKHLEFGEYWYDIEVTLSNGYVDTVIGPAKFILASEVY